MDISSREARAVQYLVFLCLWASPIHLSSSTHYSLPWLGSAHGLLLKPYASYSQGDLTLCQRGGLPNLHTAMAQLTCPPALHSFWQ